MAFPYRERSILLIDVGQESWQRIPLTEADAKTSLGGRLLALRLWDRYAEYQNLEPGAYESGNPIVIAPGSASDVSQFGCDSFTLVTRSPVTGRLSANSGEGPFAKALLGCGYSAVVFVGRFRRLSGIEADAQSVRFSNAEKLHDMETGPLAGQFPGKHVVALGPAGEHQVPYASVWCDGENFGRDGIGMVFGLKNIKYIVLSHFTAERESYDAKQSGKALQAYRALQERCAISKAMAQNDHAPMIGRANTHGWAAVDTFSLRSDGRLWGLETYLDEDAGRSGRPSYQVALALGANLELFDYGNVTALRDRCADLGLDCFSAGAVLAWARKTRVEGTLPFLPDLSRGTARQYVHILDAMAYRKGTGEQLSETMGVLVSRYGGASHAFAVSDVPLAPYDLRALPAQGLLTAFGDDTLVYPELLFGNRYRRGKEERVASWAIFSQDLRYAMESLGLPYRLSLPYFERYPLPCLSKAYRKHVFSWLASLLTVTEGYSVGARQAEEYGKEAWALQRSVDRALLSGPIPVSLPDQVLVDGRSNHPSTTVVPLARLADAYCGLRGIREY